MCSVEAWLTGLTLTLSLRRPCAMWETLSSRSSNFSKVSIGENKTGIHDNLESCKEKTGSEHSLNLSLINLGAIYYFATSTRIKSLVCAEGTTNDTKKCIKLFEDWTCARNAIRAPLTGSPLEWVTITSRSALQILYRSAQAKQRASPLEYYVSSTPPPWHSQLISWSER